jgi:hypothetical protein
MSSGPTSTRSWPFYGGIRVALERQTISIPLAQGIDTQPDPKQLAAGKLLVAENVSFNSPMQVVKRAGHERITPPDFGGALPGARTLAGMGDRLCQADGEDLYARSPSGWSRVGQLIGCGVETHSLVRLTIEQDLARERQRLRVHLRCGDLAASRTQPPPLPGDASQGRRDRVVPVCSPPVHG